MVSFYDIRPYLESLGLKYIEEYASKSRLKNKKFNDLVAGKPEQYIKEELDPSFDAVHSVENGLVDGIVTMPEAMNEAYGLGREWSRKNKMRHQAYSFI